MRLQLDDLAPHGDLTERGRAAAELVWNDDPAAADIDDPRHPDFASAFLAGLADAMRAAPGVLRKMVGHAGAAAEDLNVETFQGLVEVLQNADDLGAATVRFALVDDARGRRLLVVHNGKPVTCRHVLPMVLPYLTTKTDAPDQKGRFGIGLKTLRRIASRVAIHGAPYHFAAEAEGLGIHAVHPSPPLPGFYDPARDTLLELALAADFDVDELEAWYARFDEENLLFLERVERFAWVDLATSEERAFSVARGRWDPLDAEHRTAERRSVRGAGSDWTVYRVHVPRPEGIDRSLKATGETVPVSIALADHEHDAGLFVGFRTRIPVALPFSIDTQFDPSTARESLIENGWNRWLVARVGEVLASLARHGLARDPASAWRLIATSADRVGLPVEGWPHDAFATAFEKARESLAADAIIGLAEGRTVPVADISYEAQALEGFLQDRDLAALRPGAVPLPASVRDPAGRWRSVLVELVPDGEVAPWELADGFRRSLFDDRPIDWWVVAGDRLTTSAPDEVLGTPCWLSDAGGAVAAQAKGTTARPLVIGEPLSTFAASWRLFDRLADAYRSDPAGKRAVAWLQASAAVKSDVDAADELEAFAETYAGSPVEIDDVRLRELRDRFDLLTDRRAEPLGPRVGAALRLDGFVWRGGKKTETKVSPTQAYLPKALDNDHPYWPEAAGELPNILWLATSYTEGLRTGATRRSRKRADGTISRGPRKFLMLLGAACSPRVVATGRKDYGGPFRREELRRLGAEYVKADFASPDLERVLDLLPKRSKRERQQRSAALLRALSRHWDDYSASMRTTAYHMAIKYEHAKDDVDADWLCRLRDAEWVAVGKGDLVRPDRAVVKSPETQTAYEPGEFIAGIAAGELRGGFTKALKLITDVRASDRVAYLERVRDGSETCDKAKLLQIYRALAKLCPAKTTTASARVGDLSIQDLRRRFAAGKGLIFVSALGDWRRPAELFSGRDIFHAPERFVPGGPSCSPLWTALGIDAPALRDCISFLRPLKERPYGEDVDAVLIDVYRHIEPLLAKAERPERTAMRTLPVGTANGWSTKRPVFHVTDRELRARLAEARPDLSFWTPPCDTHSLPNVTGALGLTLSEPTLTIPSDATSRSRGDALAQRFRDCVDHLSNELARNDPAAREGISPGWWDRLREMPLAVHAAPFEVRVHDEPLAKEPIAVRMEAVLQREPPLLTVTQDAFPLRDRCGRAIASLFPRDARHRIEAEWAASWTASAAAPVKRMRMASDEEHAREVAEHAAAAEKAIGGKIKVTAPASRSPKTAPPRRLKAAHGPVGSVTVLKGSPPKPAQPPRPLASTQPTASQASPKTVGSGPVEYDARDLENRGWEILSQILNTTTEMEIVDFRKRHGIGADGVVAWKTFVELKATGGGLQSSIELSASEYQRAEERGLDFILALVCGLEEGYTTEVRLILDPLNRVAVRPMGSIRLTGLGDAPAIVLRLED